MANCKICGKELDETQEPYFTLHVTGPYYTAEKAGDYCLTCFDEDKLRTNL
jgi:hypothetical protein